ncbi:unnamed protein product [Closterium sp. Yama58-4]|nr:unnamed protein product [Closterium sp. Yama58-4]
MDGWPSQLLAFARLVAAGPSVSEEQIRELLAFARLVAAGPSVSEEQIREPSHLLASWQLEAREVILASPFPHFSLLPNTSPLPFPFPHLPLHLLPFPLPPSSPPLQLAAATSFAGSPSSPSAPAVREKPSLPFTPSFTLEHSLSPFPPSPLPYFPPSPSLPSPQLAAATSFAGSPSSPSAPAVREKPSLPFTPSFSLEHELEAREVIPAACRLALAGYSTTLQEGEALLEGNSDDYLEDDGEQRVRMMTAAALRSSERRILLRTDFVSHYSSFVSLSRSSSHSLSHLLLL